MKNIVIICSFTTPNDRYRYLIDLMNSDKFSVEFITSAFTHREKQHRELSKNQSDNIHCSTTYVNEPGYKRNVCFRRIYSNVILGRNLKRYLMSRKKPDLILAACPALEIAYNAASYAKKNNIPFIIDVRDIWPEAFRMVFNIPVISDLIYWPLTRRVNKVYQSADAVVAVSETFMERVKMSARPDVDKECVFLGCDVKTFDRYAEENCVQRDDDEIWIGYIGTLGHSYDIKRAVDAVHKAGQKTCHKIRFVVMGDGPLRNDFQRYAEQIGILCEFTGSLPYEKMVGRLNACDIVINPIVKGSAGSIINKVADYAASGLPVLNTQECAEYRSLIEMYQCGFNCNCEDTEDLALKMQSLICDPLLRKLMGNNHRRLAEERFDRAKSYQKIINLIIKHVK